MCHKRRVRVCRSWESKVLCPGQFLRFYIRFDDVVPLRLANSPHAQGASLSQGMACCCVHCASVTEQLPSLSRTLPAIRALRVSLLLSPPRSGCPRRPRPRIGEVPFSLSIKASQPSMNTFFYFLFFFFRSSSAVPLFRRNHRNFWFLCWTARRSRVCL